MAAYIPPNRRDTRYALWHVRYECRIPYLQMLDPEELIKYGMPTSGDKHHDHAMQWEPILVSLPVHRMAELWNNGANVSLVKAQDSIPIYEAIEKHLKAWKLRIESSFNPGAVPEEDLLILDRFASSIYVHAKPLFSSQFIAENFVIAGRSKHSRRATMERLRAADQTRQDKSKKSEETMVFEHIKVLTPLRHYDKATARNAVQIDYSGEEVVHTHAPRQPLSSFLRRR